MTSLETLYCLKEFRIADIPLSGVSGVVGAVCCVMCAEVQCSLGDGWQIQGWL